METAKVKEGQVFYKGQDITRLQICELIDALEDTLCQRGDENGLLKEDTIEELIRELATDDIIFARHESDRNDEASTCLGNDLLWAIEVRQYMRKGIDRANKAQQSLDKKKEQERVERIITLLKEHRSIAYISKQPYELMLFRLSFEDWETLKETK